MTLKQANSKGWNVVKGSHGVPIEFWSVYNSKTRKTISITEANELLKSDSDARNYVRFIAKYYTVFNAEQINGIPTYELPEPEPFKQQEILEKIAIIAKGMGVNCIEGNHDPCYVPALDTIKLPNCERFDHEEDYASTYLHELAHATGHSSRLNRVIDTDFGSKAYAIEELRAEISSAFMMGDLSMEYGEEHITNHKAYVQSWIAILENDPDQLFLAIKDADKIYDYMMELCPDQTLEKQKIPESRTLEERIQSAKNKTTDTTLPKKERNEHEVCV